MDKMFRNLKEKMNESVLREVDFSEESKNKVRRAINKSEKGKKTSLRPKLEFVFSLSVTCALLVGIGYYTVSNLRIFEEDKHQASDSKEIHELKESNHDVKSSIIYTPPKQEESFENMKKEEVFTKLLNTVDYFHTAVGEFEWFTKFNDASTSTINVEYKVSVLEQIGGYGKLTDLYPERQDYTSIEGFYNGRTEWTLDHKWKTYREYSDPIDLKQKTFTIEDALSIAIKDIYNAKYREYPPNGWGGLSLFPFQMAALYLRDMNQWNIVSQNADVLGHNTIVLEGNLIGEAQEKARVDTFRFWVDKDSGILVKYEGYWKGTLTNYLHPASLKINVPIDTNEFVPNLEGYKKEE